jgi:hypothetical protein
MDQEATIMKHNTENLEYIFDKVKNIHPTKKEEIEQYLIINDFIAENTKTQLIRIVKNYLTLNKSHPPTGLDYWTKRGWTEAEAWHKKKSHIDNTKGTRISPFRKEHWMNKGYSEEDAIYKSNSIRPIRKEYWMEKGYSESESENLAKNTKKSNNEKAKNNSKKQKRYTSKRCIEYYTSQGFDLETSEKLLKEHQTNFSLDKCIQKHGEIEGIEVWQQRQETWQRSLIENGNLDNSKKKSFSREILIEKFDNNLSEYSDYLRKTRNIIIYDSISKFSDEIKLYLAKKPNYKYFGAERVSKIWPNIQYELLEIDNPIDFIVSLGINREPISFKDYKQNLCLHVEKGFLRSSYEIYFYELLLKYNITFEIETPYKTSNMRCDFYLSDYDIFIEICPKLYKDEKYTKKMLYKQKVFGSILLNDIETFEDFIKGEKWNVP